jgi:hypothetical protein
VLEDRRRRVKESNRGGGTDQSTVYSLLCILEFGIKNEGQDNKIVPEWG